MSDSGAALDDICMAIQHLHDLAFLEVPLPIQLHADVLVLRYLGHVTRPIGHVDHLLHVRAYRAPVAIATFDDRGGEEMPNRGAPAVHRLLDVSLDFGSAMLRPGAV